MKDFSCIVVILSIILVSCQNQREGVVKLSKPNFIILFADDLGYHDIGAYGAKVIRTPNLDKMASEGMKFTDFYAQTVCGPSRAALMTGSYPMRVAQRNNVKEIHPVLHSEEITIAEMLKVEGYTTGCFGKWDLAKHSQKKFFPELMPTKQGFDYFFGTPTSNDAIVRLIRNNEVIEEKADMALLSKRYTDEALKFINANKDNPFFVYLPFTMPHTIIDASVQFKGKSKRGLYGDVVEEIDWNVGRIFDGLQELGLNDNTYVFFISDNGPWYLDGNPKLKAYRDQGGSHGGDSFPLRGHKTSTWEGGLRVPCIVWGQGIPTGSVCNEIASTLDVMPTIANLAGAELAKDRILDGDDIGRLIFGKKSSFDEKRVYYYYQNRFLQAIRKGKWKLHVPSQKQKSWKQFHLPKDWVELEKPLLFNLHKDIGETTDLADQNPKIVKELLEEMVKARNDIGEGDQMGSGARSFDQI